MKSMLLMRRFEECVAILSKEHPFGHFHLYIGEEATGAAVLAALRPGDLTLSTHRNHGHVVGRSRKPGPALAEILGRSGGLNGGYGGTLHMTSRADGFLQTSAVVGSAVGLATGAAHRLKRAARGDISVVFFGDGAVEEGIVFESLNMASLWKLPVIYICENNSRGAPGMKAGEYPSSEMSAKEISDIPASLQIPSVIVDGADPEAVFNAMDDAQRRARAGEGPTFIEAKTERWPGSRPMWPELTTGELDLAHAWDPGIIPEQHRAWIEEHDPIIRYARALTAHGHFKQEEIELFDQEVKAIMADARATALASPWPSGPDALKGVFAPEELV